MAKINAYRKDTGEKVRIPEHWIGHPKLGEPFTTTAPRAATPATTKAADGAAKEK